MAVVSVRAPLAPLETFLRATPRGMSFLWHEPSGAAFAGSGVAAKIDVAGRDRCARLGIETAQLFARTRHVRTAGAEQAPRPRVFGGLSFMPSDIHPPPWDEFGDGSFTLPRWTYAHVDGDAFLTLALPVGAPRARDPREARERSLLEERARTEALDELDAIIAALARAPVAGDGAERAATNGRPRLEQQSPDVWRRHIESIRAAIASGAFEKIVAARRGEAIFDHPIDDLSVVERLAWQSGSTRFAFRRDGATFLGATPETLFVKRGLALTSEALAGTVRASSGGNHERAGDAARDLLASSKNLSEHAFVVREIRRSLEPLTVEVTHADAPGIRQVRDIVHLQTPISARLRETTRAADLVAALHPTPAVGGAPTRDAARWIVENEPDHRGWYTGTIGWIDEAGDATFAVAIRAGVVRGDRAFLFTGAGIVRDSDPDAEYAETALKQQPLLRALGAAADA